MNMKRTDSVKDIEVKAAILNMGGNNKIVAEIYKSNGYGSSINTMLLRNKKIQLSILAEYVYIECQGEFIK